MANRSDVARDSHLHSERISILNTQPNSCLVRGEPTESIYSSRKWKLAFYRNRLNQQSGVKRVFEATLANAEAWKPAFDRKMTANSYVRWKKKLW